jgi:hypothetical protein
MFVKALMFILLPLIVSACTSTNGTPKGCVIWMAFATGELATASHPPVPFILVPAGFNNEVIELIAPPLTFTINL